MAQVLINDDATALYNQSAILDANNVVDPALVAENGLPWFSVSNELAVLTVNIGVSATIIHILVWHWASIASVFNVRSHYRNFRANNNRLKFWKKSTYVETFPGTEGDPHFAAMQAYKETPTWWYMVILVLSLIVGLVCTYEQKTGLPWCKLSLPCHIHKTALLTSHDRGFPHRVSAFLPLSHILCTTLRHHWILCSTINRNPAYRSLHGTRKTSSHNDVPPLRLELHVTRSSNAR